MAENRKLKVWTAQAGIVIDTIEKNGIYHVKRNFILEKYQQISRLFLEPYDWFISRAAKKIPPPPGAEYSIWVYCDPIMISNYAPGDYIIEAEVPSDNVILFDQGKWLKILNLSYIPESSADEERFKRTTGEYGLQHESKAFTTNFYPEFRREIIGSWDRLFDDSIKLSEDKMGALWEIRKEWITSIIKA
ncbi:MAG TPA: DUF3841 domain-containing protein [Clostridiaceae bacterium]